MILLAERALRLVTLQLRNRPEARATSKTNLGTDIRAKIEKRDTHSFNIRRKVTGRRLPHKQFKCSETNTVKDMGEKSEGER